MGGVVWRDSNGNGIQEATEPGLMGVRVKLLVSGVQIGETTSAGDGHYAFTILLPGTYQIQEVQPSWLRFSSTPNEVTIIITGGEYAVVNFGDWTGLGTWMPLIIR
jgi:hypothetical protein